MASYDEATSAPRRKLAQSILEEVWELRDIATKAGLPGGHFFLQAAVKGPNLKLDEILKEARMAAELKLEINGSEELKKYMEMELLPSSVTHLKVLEARWCGQKLTKFLSILLQQSHGPERLIIEHCETLKQVFDLGDLAPDKQGPPLFPKLEAMTLYGLPKLIRICNNDNVKLGNLVTLEIIECGLLKGPLSAALLEKLVVLKIISCEMIEQVIVEEDTEMQEKLFLHLENIQLVSLPKLTKFFPNMALSNPGRILSFQRLIHLRVCRCNQLRYVLPLYVLENLQQLENIEISDCEMLERVFGDEDETCMSKSKNPVQLRQVKSLILENLPIFSGCCQDGSIVAWLSLERVRVVKCGMIQKSSLGMIERTQLTSMEVIECNTWANNEDLESNIIYLFKFSSELPGLELKIKDSEELKNYIEIMECWPSFLSRLKILEARQCDQGLNKFLSILFLRSHGLEQLTVENCELLEQVFDFRDLTPPENYCELLPDLSQLHLRNLGKLRSIVGLNLENYPERTLSFKMLNHLIVCGCDQLRYALPLYALQNLQQLENIEIRDCKMLERVFGYEEYIPIMRKSKNTITLPQVKSLILEQLPKFSGCCQDECIIEWLSLKMLRVVNCDRIQKSSLGTIERPLLASVEVKECNIWANNEDLESNIVHLFHLTDELSRREMLEIRDSEELKNHMEMELLASSLSGLRILKAKQCDQELNKFLTILLRRSHRLEELTVSNCELLEQVFDLSEFVAEEQINLKFPNLNTMQLLCLPKLKCIWNKDPRGIVGLGKLVKLEIIKCGLHKSPLSSALLEQLVLLEALKMESCEMIEQVIEDDTEIMQERSFSNLKDLQLVSLPKLIKFNSGHCNFRFPNLLSLSIEKCPEVNAFTIGFLSKKTLTTEGTSDHVPPNEIMDALSKLERLKLVGHESFEEIWHGHVSNNITKCELKEVEVDSFSKLRYVFPSTMLPILSETLETLVVRNCTSLSDVFQLIRENNDSVIAFENLKIVRVKGCGSLQHLFLPCSYPMLTEIDISDCQSLQEIFIDTQIKGDDKCFPNLKSIVLENLPMLSSFSLDTLAFPNLQIVRIVNCPETKTFSRNALAEMDSSESPSFGHGKTRLLPQLLQLELSDLPKIRLWDWEPQIPVFEMLTSLKIIGCGSMEKLFSISVAMHLSSLKLLTLYKCENMVHVLHGEGRIGKIVFKKLETLVLKHLPRLTSFCEELHYFDEFPELKMVRVENVPNMKIFVKMYLKTPKLKQVYVTYVTKCWRENLNETITYLHENHEKLKKEVWKTDHSRPGNSLKRYKDAAESSPQGMRRTSWRFKEVETEGH